MVVLVIECGQGCGFVLVLYGQFDRGWGLCYEDFCWVVDQCLVYGFQQLVVVQWFDQCVIEVGFVQVGVDVGIVVGGMCQCWCVWM